ncbi:hypothetical protein VTI74DRAFT_1193 [Chaetomium olivicolor]
MIRTMCEVFSHPHSSFLKPWAGPNRRAVGLVGGSWQSFATGNMGRRVERKDWAPVHLGYFNQNETMRASIFLQQHVSALIPELKGPEREHEQQKEKDGRGRHPKPKDEQCPMVSTAKARGSTARTSALASLRHVESTSSRSSRSSVCQSGRRPWLCEPGNVPTVGSDGRAAERTRGNPKDF